MNYIVGLLKTKTTRANVMMPLFAEPFPTADRGSRTVGPMYEAKKSLFITAYKELSYFIYMINLCYNNVNNVSNNQQQTYATTYSYL